MLVLDRLNEEYEQIVFAHDPASGLRTIVSVYSTALGPALGGTRFWPFATEDEALNDVLRLSKAMAYKAAGAGLALGGGKAVIIGDPKAIKTPELLRAYGRVVDRMSGSYLTTADVGTNADDMSIIATSTPFVTGTPGASGDPSPNTSYGVYAGLHAVAERLWASPSLADRSIVVQGVGKVGAGLVRLLVEEGARVVIADLDGNAADSLAKETGTLIIPVADALNEECDILAPCALGPVVTDQTLASFRCKAIAGAANNQLERPDHGRALHEAGILYAPDYIINAGGLINVAGEVLGYGHDEARRRAEAIKDTLATIFNRAAERGSDPSAEADALAGERIGAATRTFGGPGGSR